MMKILDEMKEMAEEKMKCSIEDEVWQISIEQKCKKD